MGAVAELLTCRNASADWQGRSGEPSGRCCWHGAPWRRAIGKMLLARGAVAESHREDVAGRAAVAELLPMGTVAELLLAVKSYSTIGKRILAKMRARRSSCGMPVELN